MRYLRPFAGAALAIVAALALMVGPASAQTHLKFDPTDYHTLFLDFDDYEAAQWIITTTEAGGGDATEAVGNLGGGILVVTNDAADNDADFFQWSGVDKSTSAETFNYNATKALFFKARFKVSDATQSDLVFGLQATDTTPLAVANGIWFGKDDGDTHLDFHIANTSVQTDVADIAELADDTYVTVAFYYPGSGSKITLYVNDVAVGTAPITNAPAVALSVSFGAQNGETVAKILSVDYIAAMRARG